MVVVTDPAVPFGSRLAAALASAGTTVGVLSEGRPAPVEAAQATCQLSSASSVLEAAGLLTDELEGAWQAVVWAHVAPEAARGEPVGGLEEPGWAALAEAPLTGFFHLLQAARRHLCSTGRSVVVVPSEVLTGAPGLVGWTAAAEGQRALLRVAARCWGPSGFRGHCLAVPASVLLGGTEAAGIPAPRLAPATGTLPSLGEVAEVVTAVLAPSFQPVTGDTLCLDGGSWLAP